MGSAAIIAAVVAAITAISSGVTGGVKAKQADRARRETMHMQIIANRQTERRRIVNENHFRAQNITDMNDSKSLQQSNLVRQTQLQDESIGRAKAKETQFNLDELSNSAGNRANTLSTMNTLRGF